MTFDMQAARKIAENCKSKNESVDHDYWNAHAGMVLPAALDEIARLQLRDAAMQAQIVADVGQQAEQAVSLDAAESLIRKNTEMINGQAKQIATLKDALISDRSKLLFLFKDRIFGMPEMINGSDEFKESAIKKLAQEYPEIAWEEKKWVIF